MADETKFELEDDDPPPPAASPSGVAPRATGPSPVVPLPVDPLPDGPPSPPLGIAAEASPRGAATEVRRAVSGATRPGRARDSAGPAGADAPATGFLARFPPRVQRRLKRCVIAFGIAFGVMGWVLAGSGAWPFVLFGAAVGVFAAWRQSDEIVLAAVSAAAGYAAWTVVLQRPPLGLSAVIAIGLFGGFGALMAIDDRLGEGTSKLLDAGDDRKKPPPAP